jgi:hypothetical protein
MRWLLLLGMLTLPSVGCGSDDDGLFDNSGTGGAASGGTSATLGGSATVTGGASGATAAGGQSADDADACPTVFARAVDVPGGCVPPSTPVEIGCANFTTDGEFCAKRVSDGEVFAMTHPLSQLDPTVWAQCTFDERLASMVSCELRALCGEDAVTSICTLAEMRQQIGCSVTDMLTDDCCKAPVCVPADPDPCGPGFACLQVRNYTREDCFYESDGVCRCHGLPTGSPENRCLPAS